MGEDAENIEKACLSVDSDRVFVGFKEGILYSATKDFYNKFKKHIWACHLPQKLKKIPRKGQCLCITFWHNYLPVKIELREKEDWIVIFKRNKLSKGVCCLAGCKVKGLNR